MFATAAFGLLVAGPIPHFTIPVDATIVQRLVAALGDSDPDVRSNLGAALAKIGTETVGPLTAALRDGRPDRRAGAAYALGQIGEPARAALPILVDLLEDANADVRRQASYAVSRIVPAGTRSAP